MIENTARRSLALLIAGLAVLGTVGVVQATSIGQLQSATLADDTDPSDGTCWFTRACLD